MLMYTSSPMNLFSVSLLANLAHMTGSWDGMNLSGNVRKRSAHAWWSIVGWHDLKLARHEHFLPYNPQFSLAAYNK